MLGRGSSSPWGEIEAISQFRWDQGAGLLGATEETVADSGDEVVDGVAQEARREPGDGRQRSPDSSEAGTGMEGSVGAHEHGAVLGQQNYAIR